MTEIYHIPALLEECMDAMALRGDSICVDVTFGGGGHSREILSRLGDKGHLYSFDQDLDTLRNLNNDHRFTFVHSNFRFLKNFLKYHDVDQADAILADLGVSFHHFDADDRGFSFRYEDSPLDMRMNQQSKKTAAHVLNTYSEQALADIFFLYGELRQSRRIASSIVKARASKPYRTINNLLETLEPFTPKGEKEKKVLAQAFQALRIEVNDEMEALKDMLRQSLEMLKPQGRLVVITYHSLEDRLVKNFFKTGSFEGNVDKDFYGNISTPFRLVNNKVIVPSKEEEMRNPRSRSAKLRIAEKK